MTYMDIIWFLSVPTPGKNHAHWVCLGLDALEVEGGVAGVYHD